jgi:hypothetical protein
MPSIFEKLNLGEHREILVLNAPESFDSALGTLQGVRVVRGITAVKKLSFALAFVTQQAQLDRLSKTIAAKAAGDALLWFAYPKASSKRYPCDFNRDQGWDALRKLGFDSVRQVAIDEDWSALRFRRLEFINHRAR